MFIKIKNHTLQTLNCASSLAYQSLNELCPSKIPKETIKNLAQLIWEEGEKSLFFVPIHLCPVDAQKVITAAFTDYNLNIFNTHGFSTKSEAEAQAKYQIEKSEKNGAFTYFVCYVFTKKKAIPVGLIHIYRGSSPEEVSFYFATFLPRQGIGTRMAKTIINQIRAWKKNVNQKFHEDMKLVIRIETSVDAENKASNGVFLKLGFSQYPEQRISSFKRAYRYVLPIS